MSLWKSEQGAKSAAKVVTQHEAKADPHPQYYEQVRLGEWEREREPSENLLINGHLRYDRYHFWQGASTQPLLMQRDIVADAVLYGWGGAPYDMNEETSNTLALEREVLPPGAVGRALKFVVDNPGAIDATGDAAYHHHFRLIVPPERVAEIGSAGGVYLNLNP